MSEKFFRVLLRADLNMPMRDGRVVDDHKFHALRPTLDKILESGGKVVLITHLGRPKGLDPELSTEKLVSLFSSHWYRVRFEADLEKAREVSRYEQNEIVLLENLRFFPGEKGRDFEFARTLASLGDYYVNDAFGVIHRTDASVTLVPELFAADKKSVGLLIGRECAALDEILHPKQPFVYIQGGGKIADKIPLLMRMMEKASVVLLCPAFSSMFVSEMGGRIGKSLIDERAREAVRECMRVANERGVKVVVPIDYQVAMGSFQGALCTVSADEFPDNGFAMSIGPRTVDLFAREIEKAATVFLNGVPGDPARLETLEGARGMFAAMGRSSAYSVIAGGDSSSVVQILGATDSVSYCSTGGGAALAYLAGEPLPGLNPGRGTKLAFLR